MISGPLSYLVFRETGSGSVKVPVLSRNGPKFHLADGAFEDQAGAILTATPRNAPNKI